MNSAPIKYDDQELIETVKRTVAKGATDAEFQMFWQFAKSAQLNPFKKELWLVPTRNGAQIMLGINGYLAIANSHDQYDGMEVDTVRDEKGALVEAVARVYRKDRSRPSVGRAIWREDAKPTPLWKEKPTLMLEKVAKARAIREAFPTVLNGTYIEDEMPPEYSAQAVEVSATVVEERKEPAAKPYSYDLFSFMSKEQARELYKRHASRLEYSPKDEMFYAPEPIADLANYGTDETLARLGIERTEGADDDIPW